MPFAAKNHISAQYVPMTFHVSNTFYFINKELVDLIFLFTFLFFLWLGVESFVASLLLFKVALCHICLAAMRLISTPNQRRFDLHSDDSSELFFGFTCFLHATLNIHKTFLCFPMLFDAFYAFLCWHIKMARDFGEKLVNHSHKGNFTIHQ